MSVYILLRRRIIHVGFIFRRRNEKDVVHNLIKIAWHGVVWYGGARERRWMDDCENRSVFETGARCSLCFY